MIARSGGSKPDDLSEYATWMWQELGVDARLLEGQHPRVTHAMKRQFEECKPWRMFLDAWDAARAKYYLEEGYVLASPDIPEVVEKSWASFWLKTYRRNVLDNGRWPRPPVGGWLTPGNWYTKIGDTVRTRIVVRYLDGIEAVLDALRAAAAAAHCPCEVSMEARAEGYYAAHVSWRQPFEIPSLTFDTNRVRARVEIQVTTQVKDVIQELLHKYYEESRRRPAEQETDWQWDYMSEQFRAAYTGHVAHHMEAVIMDLRKRGQS